MSNLKKQIELDTTEALRLGHSLKRSTLSLVKAAISLWETNKKNVGKEITDEDVIGIIQSEVKKRNELLSLLSTHYGPQTIEAEAEKTILIGYLPTQMTAEQIDTSIDLIIIANPEAKSMKGTIMKYFSENFKGKYDSKILSDLVDKRLVSEYR